jgi:hypothetical protein
MGAILGLVGIAAILGFLGGLIILLASYIYDGIFKMKNIVIEITPSINGDGSKGLIQVKNKGGAPVTNLILTIESPKEIMSYSNFSTLSGVTFKEIAPTILRADVPKFIHGDGSLLLVYTTISGSQTAYYSNYSAYATYDEGSQKGKLLSSTFLDPRDTLIGLSIGIGLIITLGLTAVIMLFEFLKTLRLSKIRESIK